MSLTRIYYSVILVNCVEVAVIIISISDEAESVEDIRKDEPPKK